MVENTNNTAIFSTIVIATVWSAFGMIYTFGSIELNKKTEAEDELKAHMIKTGTVQLVVNILLQIFCFILPTPSSYALR